MKARMPQQPSRQEMLQKLQKMQDDMQSLQADLDAREYEVSSGGGVVKIKINGVRRIQKITIDPSVVDPSDTEMLEDLITAAVNEAIETVDKTNEQEMGAVTSGLNLPGMPGLGL